MRRGFLIGALVGFLFVTAWDVKLYGVTIFRGWPGRVADTLHEWHGGESHAGREGR